MSYGRAHTKLSEAIEAMAISAQHTIQQRLAIAHMFHLRSVEPHELPSEVQSEFKELQDKLTRIPAIFATPSSMSTQEGIEIAKELVRISRIVAEHHRVGF
jgi:hypothetical protein